MAVETNTLKVTPPPAAPAFSGAVTVQAASTNAIEAGATNELELLQKRLVETDAEARKLAEREAQLKMDYRAAVGKVSACVTNFTATDEEDAKTVLRIKELEKELRDLRQKHDARMAEDPQFKTMRQQLETTRSELQSVQARKDELRQLRMTTSGRIWQIRKQAETAAAKAKQAATNAPPVDAGAKP